MGRTRAAPEIYLPLVRATLTSVRLGEVSDGELVGRFVASRDEEAFSELVRRLGPTVLGVCRRVLGPGPDADDAFQVVFMILTRKAASVRPQGRIAAWLHGVAVLAARKARQARARRLARETAVAPPETAARPSALADPDLGRVLDEEIGRLPTNYRLAVILCEIREMTVAQAAASLGWPVGTVASRLSRGREMLATRLSRRGVAAGAVLAAFGGTLRAGAVASSRLIGDTIAAAVAGVTGTSPTMPHLLREVLLIMTMKKMLPVAACLLAAVGAVLGGIGFLRTAANAAPVPVPVTKPAPPGEAKLPRDPIDRLALEGASALLKVDAVAQELRLSDEQRKAINGRRAAKADRIKDAIRKAIQGAVQGPAAPNNVDTDGISALVGDDRELDRDVVKELKPAQVRRLKQILLQAKGPEALLERHAIRALNLTAEQEDRIEPLVRGLPAGGKPAIAAREEAADAARIDKAWSASLGVLTPEQRGKWTAFVGKQLPAAVLQKASAGAGGVDLSDALKDIDGVIKGAIPNVPPPPE